MRFLSVFLLILACCGAMRPAAALNGAVNLTSCACKTTTDFVTAAKAQARLFDQNGGGQPRGNYAIASTSGAVNDSGAPPLAASTSSHVTGVDTVGVGRARRE